MTARAKRSPKSSPLSASTLPWFHDSLVSLATALGVTDRTLENWRGKGCPLPEISPFDELTVRMWHLTQPTGKKATMLAPPRDVLAPYVVAATQIRQAVQDAERDSKTDPADLVKRRTAEKLQLANDKARDVMRQRAMDCFLSMLGRLQKQLDLRLGGQLSAEVWSIAQRPRIESEPLIRRKVMDIAALAVNESLIAAKSEG